MKFPILCGLIIISSVHSSQDFGMFLNDFFIFKNVRTIHLSPCSLQSNELAEWRKQSEELFSLQTMIPTSMAVSGLTGVAVNHDCSTPVVLQSLPETFRRNTVLVLFSDDPSKTPEELLTQEISNLVYESYAAKKSEYEMSRSILVYNSRSDLIMTWNLSDGIVIFKDPIPKSLPGITVRGVISLKDSRIRKDELLQTLEDVNREFVDDNLMKFSFVLHNLLKTVYNFDWELHLTGLQSVHQVYANINGSLTYYMNGTQFGALRSQTDDVGLYPAEFLPSGLDSFEYLPPLLKFRQAFVFSSPQTYLEPYILYTQFSGAVWAVSLCLALMAAFVASFSLKSIYPENCEENNESSVPSSVLVVVGALAQQGLGKTYDSISLRIAHLSLLILTTLLYMFYNTGLLIYMLNPSQKEVQSFPELVYKTGVISAHDTPYNRFQLEGNYSQPSERLYGKCETESTECKVNIQYYNLDTAVGKIQNEKAAYFGYVSNVYGILDDVMSDKEKIDLREVTVHKPFLVGTFVRKNFLYKEQFFRGLLLLREAGILCHEDRKWNAKKPEPLAEPNFVSASLYSTNVAFGVLFVGIVLSMLTVIFEICASRYETSRIEKRSKQHRIQHNDH